MEVTSDNLNVDTVADLVSDAERGPTETGAMRDLAVALAMANACYRHLVDLRDPTSKSIREKAEFSELGTQLEQMTASLVYLRSGRGE